MAAKNSGLDDKDSFVSLTDKQKTIVNALAKHPDKGDTEIAEIASSNLGNDTVSRSYVNPIKQKYSHLIEQQREILENKRETGTEKTTGNPLEGLEERLGQGESWQTIKERPEKGTPQEASQEATISIELGKRDVEALLGGDVPESVRSKLVEALFRRSFE